jgi:hypothetical protein
MHLMTTSNHTPFTFPEGRIDLPRGRQIEDWRLDAQQEPPPPHPSRTRWWHARSEFIRTPHAARATACRNTSIFRVT